MKKHAIFLGLLAIFYALLCISFLIIMLCYAANGFRSITEMHQGKTELVMGKMCRQSQCEPAVLLNTNGAFNEDIKDKVRHLINNASSHPRWLCLNSAGGNPMKAYPLAHYIYRLKLNTCVVPIKDSDGVLHHSICASACIKLFLSGSMRIAQANALGVHRSYCGVSAACNPANLIVAEIFHGLDMLDSYYFFYSSAHAAFRRNVYRQIMHFSPRVNHGPGKVHWVTKEEFVAWNLGKPENYSNDYYFTRD